MKRLTIITIAVVVALAAGALDTRLTARAQPAGRVFRVGDAIVTLSTAATLAATQATTTIPIVYAVVSPVERMIVGSLARPGGNVTGLSSDVGPAIQGKRLELLKEAVPRLIRVAYLVDTTFEEEPGTGRRSRMRAEC